MKKYPKLKYQLLTENAKAPVRGTVGSSGLDVFSPIDIVVPGRGDALIPLDIRFDIPFGWDLAVYNKSGVATKKKLSKGAELVDSDYRGTVHIHFFNNSDTDVHIKKGDKISQLVMREVWMGELEESSDISTETERGAGAFGSTGTN
jgi:dUTP pyrophosphatase